MKNIMKRGIIYGKENILFDFDGTIVTEDILDVVCDIVGKKEESIINNEKTHTGELTGL